MALVCVALALGCARQLVHPYGGPGMIQWAVKDSFWWPLLAALAYLGLVTAFLGLGALLLLFRTRFGRTLTVLGGLGFLAGAVASQVYARSVAQARFYFDPLVEPWAVGVGSVGIILAIGAIICAVSARR